MRKLMSQFFLVALILAMTCSLALAQARPKVGKYAKVYKGSEGLYLTIVKVGPQENNEVLFLIEGIDHPWDGKIMVAVEKTYRDKTEYVLQVNGKDYVAFIKRSGSGELYLQNVRKPDNVHYHEERSKQVVPENLLTKYLKQK